MFNYNSNYCEASVEPLHGWSKTHKSNYKFNYKSNYGEASVEPLHGWSKTHKSYYKSNYVYIYLCFHL